jgi:hypothetical protein
MRTPFIVAALALTFSATGHAQLQLADGKIWITSQDRVRVEYRVNNVTFDSSVGGDTDLFLLTRTRFGVGAKPCDWLKIYGELQDAREIDSRRVPRSSNAEEGTIDWRQGWFELGNPRKCPFGVKVGRQELSYGDERLIGAFDWNNVGRVFDAVKLRWQHGKCWLDFFAADVVNNNVASAKDGSFDDTTSWGDDFYGLYGRTTALEKHAWDLYFLFRDKSDASLQGAARQIYTVGTRFATNEKMTPWDYYVEIAGQFGHVQTPGGLFGETLAGWASHRAWALVVGAGYTWAQPWKPRLGLEYNYASGDNDPNDGTNETFDNLFPTNHKFFGYIDLFAWKNLHNPRATVSFAPLKYVKVQLDGHLFWLAEKRDAWYRATQASVRRDATGAAGSFVGSEIDLTVNYTPHKRVKVQAGYSRFFTGDFVEDTGQHSDADFAYAQVTLSL